MKMIGNKNGTKAILLLRKPDKLLTLAWEPEMNIMKSKPKLRIKSKRLRSQSPPKKCRRMLKHSSLITRVANGNFSRHLRPLSWASALLVTSKTIAHSILKFTLTWVN